MIRVSIDLPQRYEYRLRPLLDHQDMFLDAGMFVDFNLANPDLRIVHQDDAAEEVEASPNGRLRTPVIVDERVDSAGVLNTARIRDLMVHPDVKLWLKRNIFRDYRLNNENYLAGRLHYRMLNDLEKFHFANTAGEDIERPVTAEMAAKIRPLPVAPIHSFDPLRQASIDWTARRDIDVVLAGTVDYALRHTDYWDGAFDEAQAGSATGFDALIDQHRREAVRQLVEIRHLRIFIGMNRAVPKDLYHQAMLRTSIGVSPWGLGEYAYRDYETILAGAVLVKPKSDYVLTFAPDIYQSNKYYVPCAPDFSDLYDVIRSIMSNRARSIDLARTAREALLDANSPRRIVDYFVSLFNEALGRRKDAGAAQPFPSARTLRPPMLGIAIAEPAVVRGNLEGRKAVTPGLDVEKTLAFREDATERNTHDIRLMHQGLVMPGLYRLRCMVRGLGRRHLAVQVHHGWADAVSFHVDLKDGAVNGMAAQGNGLELVGKPKAALGVDGWLAVSAFVQVDRAFHDQFGLVLYATENNASLYYTGLGEDCFEIAALDIDRVDDFGN